MKYTYMSQQTIKILSEEVINKIAAGEVIERPASVLKELLENSLDAGSTDIAIELREGGKKLISVSDNGCGIPAAEVELAFQRHATSKISSFEDLDMLSTLGFRGEALPSIASVSKASVLTRTKEALAATKVELHAGKIVTNHQEGGSTGTTIRVEGLFYNTPARRKFLKTTATEYTHNLNMMTELALAHWQVGITLIHDRKEVFKLPPVEHLDERIYDLFGKETQEHLLTVHLEQKFLNITGLVSSGVLSRPTRNQQYFFVNNRSVRHKLFSHAVNSAYETLLPAGKYPLTFLFLQIDPEQVDVNVHPSKKEVRFSNEGAVHELLLRALKETLHHSTDIAQVSDKSEETSYKPFVPEPQYVHEKPQTIYTPDFPVQTVLEMPDKSAERPPAKPNSVAEKSWTPLLADFTIIGQADNTFIIAANDKGLIIIDQHAASERITYEKLKNEFRQKAIASQKLLLPITIELEPASKTIVLENTALLEQLGWEVEDFGKNTLLIRALPAILEKSNDRQYILDILKVVEELGEIKENCREGEMRNLVLDKILKLSACHAAIRVGDKLNLETMRQLVKSLGQAETPLTCPHGRPTTIQLTKEELFKHFGRL